MAANEEKCECIKEKKPKSEIKTQIINKTVFIGNINSIYLFAFFR